MILQKIICPFILILILGCSSSIDNTGVEYISYDDFKSDSLRGEYSTLEISDYGCNINIIDSMAFFVNYVGKRWISVYDLKNGKRLGDFLNIGRASKELERTPNGITIDENMNTVTVFSGLKILVFSLNAVKNIRQDSNIYPIKSIPLPFHMERVVSCGESGFVGTHLNLSIEKRLVYFNEKGDTICISGEYPELKETNLGSQSNPWAFQSNIISCSEKERVVIFNKITNIIEMYDTHGNFIKYIKGPDYFEPKLSDLSTGQMMFYGFASDCKEAFFWPTAKKDHFWVIYKGTIMDDIKEKSNPTKIMAFDWNGKPKHIFHLDCKIDMFDVDEEHKIIYALIMEEGGEIRLKTFKYDL